MRLAMLFLSLTTFAGCAADAPDGKSNPTDPTNPTNPGDNPGDNPGGTTTPTSLSVADFLTGLGHKECDDAFTCKANFPTDQGVTFEQAFGADKNACYAEAATFYDPAAVQASIAAGKIDYDGTAAKTCLDGVGAPTCATYWTQGGNYPAACDTAMVGKVATGAACTNDFECAGENWCDDTTKKCAAIPAGARVAPADGGVMALKAKVAARLP